MERNFLESFSKYIKKDDILILAVSGGVDSMAMVHMILCTHDKEKIIIAHFDHSLRGDESDGDRIFVENYCRTRGILFVWEKLDISQLAREEKMSIEHAARKYRYEFLFRIAREKNAGYLLTAHHSDDRIETAIFNLIRWSKLAWIHALSGLEHRAWITLFRPLIGITKADILEYAEKHGIEFREDSTNKDTEYQRNHLRISVLPEFEKINPEYRKVISTFIEYTEELKNWIDQEVEKFFGEKSEFSALEFAHKTSFFQKEAIRYLYEKTHQGTIWLSEGNIDELIRFICTANGGTEKRIGKLILKKKTSTIYYGVDL